MLELILLYRLWKRIGIAARAKGRKAIGYQLLMVLCWWGGDIGGVILGAILLSVLFGESIGQGGWLLMSYITGIGGAIFGVWFVFKIVNDLPEPVASEPERDQPASPGGSKQLAATSPLPPGQATAISAEPMNMPPIPLTPIAPAKQTATAPARKEPEVKDNMREMIETVVFVVVLVLMLKTFLAEAFVIPTGSMADTLLGYQHNVTCKACGKQNYINASSAADPQGGEPEPVVQWKCENCRQWNDMK